MNRFLFNSLVVLSLLVLASSVVVWVRSYQKTDWFIWNDPGAGLEPYAKRITLVQTRFVLPKGGVHFRWIRWVDSVSVGEFDPIAIDFPLPGNDVDWLGHYRW